MLAVRGWTEQVAESLLLSEKLCHVEFHDYEIKESELDPSLVLLDL